MYPLSFIHSFYQFEKNTMIILCNPQIAELIEAASTFKSDIIISKNKTKPKKERETKTKNKEIGKQYYNKITTYYNKSQVS